MSATYEPIATTTLSSTAASIVFNMSTSVKTYTDLRLILTATGSTANTNINLRLNGDSGTTYSRTVLRANGSAASSSRTSSTNQIVINADGGLQTSVPTFYQIDIFSYLAGYNKSVLVSTSEDRNGAGSVSYIAGQWRNTGGIYEISLTAATGTFSVGSTATLYGIKAE